jgi:hypothetical protein
MAKGAARIEKTTAASRTGRRQSDINTIPRGSLGTDHGHGAGVSPRPKCYSLSAALSDRQRPIEPSRVTAHDDVFS